ncbi:hypothetical protein G6F31_020536 [Rhizopus arrhizus]|nr:hypothetical protein G6F31_020536 [Rhizopus arrhizus]
MRPWRAASYRAGVSSCGAIASSGAVSAAAANIGSCSWLVAFNAPVRNDTSGAGATRCSSRCSSGDSTTTASAAGHRALSGSSSGQSGSTTSAARAITSAAPPRPRQAVR